MSKFTELMSEDKEVAAGMLEDGIRFLINNYVPKITVSKEEFSSLLSIIREGRSKDPVKYFREKHLEKDPIIENNPPTTGLLKITYVVEPNPGNHHTETPDPYIEEFQIGSPYKVIPPYIDGYKADITAIDGVMKPGGVNITVTYHFNK